MRIKQGYKVREIAGENVVIMQGHGGVDMTRVIALNDSSILLWNNLLDIDFSTDDVKHILLENYEVEEAIAAADAQAWIEKMQQAGLVE
ncbi:MAG: PqqD family peptide modification chaperone [Alistipes sp.]|nr:PqqD family peptide modification chaperone [Alistipes sp.]